MDVCNYQRILQPLIITSFLTQKHLNYHLKGTTSENSAELYSEGNERQLCVGDCAFTICKSPYTREWFECAWMISPHPKFSDLTPLKLFLFPFAIEHTKLWKFYVG